MSLLRVKYLGLRDYEPIYAEMSAFNEARNTETDDEAWFLEHAPVYTLGMAGKSEHILDAQNIAIVTTDRGGQVTYHGPGQLVLYLMIDLKRKGFGIKQYVSLLEQIILDFLEQKGISGCRRQGAPGVYVDESKIAALGVRVRKGRAYHGLSLNVNMDLHPFLNINPCGYPGLDVTQLTSLGIDMSLNEVAEQLLPLLKSHLDYQSCDIIRG